MDIAAARFGASTGFIRGFKAISGGDAVPGFPAFMQTYVLFAPRQHVSERMFAHRGSEQVFATGPVSVGQPLPPQPPSGRPISSFSASIRSHQVSRRFSISAKKRGRCVPRSLLYFLLFSWFSPEDHSPILPSSFRKNQAATLASSVVQRALPAQTSRKLREIRHRQNRADLVWRFFRDQSHPFLHFFAQHFGFCTFRRICRRA